MYMYVYTQVYIYMYMHIYVCIYVYTRREKEGGGLPVSSCCIAERFASVLWAHTDMYGLKSCRDSSFVCRLLVRFV